MFEFLCILMVAAVAVIAWRKAGALEARVDALESAALTGAATDTALAALRRRVEVLERTQAPASVAALPAATPGPPVMEAPPDAAVEVRRAADTDIVMASVEPAIAREPRRTSVEWETMLGGNWLNKAGVVLLVIGIALLMRYYAVNVGPLGRILQGAAASAVMLAAGVFAERRASVKAFGQGLIGGGWAAAYFTAFAAHGITASRIIESPVAATAVLGAVAAGMIVHSLRYRSQVVTALAYFLGFATLGFSDLSIFAITATLPLAGCLLYTARRFGWFAMAALGMPLTYGVFLCHALRLQGGNPAGAQVLLAMYWLVFEAFSVLRAPSTDAQRDMRWVGANAACLLPLTFMVWRGMEQGVFTAAAIAASLYLLSAVVRCVALPRMGGFAEFYHAPVSIATGMAALAAIDRLSGIAAAGAILAGGELLFVAGVLLKDAYLRALATGVLAFSQVRLFADGAARNGHTAFLGREWHNWTGVVAGAAALSYLNRFLPRGAQYFSYSGAALTTLIIGTEVRLEWAGVACILAATVLLEGGLRARARDVQCQAGGIAAVGIAALALVNACGIGLTGERLPWIPQLSGAALLLGGAVRVHFARELEPRIAAAARGVASAAGTALLAVYAWNVLPATMVALAWAGIALLLIELGESTGIEALRFEAHAMAAAAFGRIFFANLHAESMTVGVSHRVLTVVPLIAVQYYLYARAVAHQPRIARLHLYLAGAASALLIRFEAGRALAVPGWAALMVAYVVAGRRWRMPDLVAQSYALGIGCFVRSWSTDFYDPQVVGSIPLRVVTASFAAACLFAAEFLSERASESVRKRGWIGWIERKSRLSFALLGAALVALLLSNEVSGRLLTMTWGIEGALLLAAGFAAHERTLRLSGIALLLVCTAKLFAYDLRNVETPYRIASFLVLGLLMVLVSWVYSRYRTQIEKYL